MEELTEKQRESIPTYSLTGLSVLDVGCRSGRHLAMSYFKGASRRCGIDPDQDAIAIGKATFPDLDLRVGYGESLPFVAEEFDVGMSRLALPYTNVPVALRELHRVMKPEGRLFLLMHDWRMQRGWLRAAVAQRHWKRVIDHVYIVAHSAWLHVTGHSFARLGRATHESFQSPRSISRCLTRAGFHSIEIKRIPAYLIVQARK